jgi:hypothetical protein
MRNYIIITLLISSFQLFSQKKIDAFNFNHEGENFTIEKGTQIQLGMGSKDDGSFVYIHGNEFIPGSSKTVRVNLDKQFSNREATVSGVRYSKKIDQYFVYIRLPWGGNTFELQLAQAISKGEVNAINGVAVGNATKTSSNQKNITSSTLDYVLYLKNGSEIKCNLLEIKSNETIKIQTFDESIFVYNLLEVKELRRSETSSEKNNQVQESFNQNIQINQTKKESEKKIENSKYRGFYNSTDFKVFIPNSIDLPLDITSSSTGYGFNNISGFKFNQYFAMGGGFGFNVHPGENETDYYFGYVALGERISILGDKRVSPEISLIQGLGYLMSAGSGTVGTFDGTIGLNIKATNKLYLHTGAGYTMQFFEYGRSAQYFHINLGLHFVNKKAQTE